MSKNPAIFYLDFETSGLSPLIHAPVQIAWIVEKDDEIVSEKMYYIKPDDNTNFCMGALKTHGITIEELYTKGVERELVVYALQQDFRIAALPDRIVKLCGHMVSFDISFLSELVKNQKYMPDLSYHGYLCTKNIASFYDHIGLLPVKNHKLQTIADYYGIKFQAHDALNDVRVTREIFHKFKNQDFKKAE